MTQCAIRQAVAVDRGPMAAVLEGESFWSTYGLVGDAAAKLVDAAIATGGATVADTGTVAGWIWVVPGGGFGRADYVKILAVDPASQGLGIGRMLMRQAEQQATPTPGGLFVMASSANAKAIAFYAALGYQPVGRVPDLVLSGLDEILFWKDLRG